MAMKLVAVLKPLAARLACCSKPFMASTYALLRLSNIPRTTPSMRCFKVAASFLNGSSRQRVAQLSQLDNSALACASLLCLAALAYTVRRAIFKRQARALFKVECCNQCIALSCFLLQPSGLRRMPQARLLSNFRSLSPSAALIDWG